VANRKQYHIKGFPPKAIQGSKFKPCGVCRRGTLKSICRACAERIEALQSVMEIEKQQDIEEHESGSEAVKQWTQGTLF
jgi:recombinational DNA repair protein RecR